MWDMYRRVNPDARSYEAWCFGDSGDVADELADLVMNGRKTATASILQLYQMEKAPIPSVGGLNIILNSKGEAVCIVRTSDVRICRFCDVTPEHAYKEGEGDGTLEHWRKVHRDCFTRELEAHDLLFDENIMVVCETFVVVFTGLL